MKSGFKTLLISIHVISIDLKAVVSEFEPFVFEQKKKGGVLRGPP